MRTISVVLGRHGEARCGGVLGAALGAWWAEVALLRGPAIVASVADGCLCRAQPLPLRGLLLLTAYA